MVKHIILSSHECGVHHVTFTSRKLGVQIGIHKALSYIYLSTTKQLFSLYRS